MAVTYEQVRQVIAVPPDSRRDFDVNSLLPWFQKRSYVFSNLKTKLLFDVIKNLQLIRVDEDEIVIRQGDKGDCMFIILGGQVTIYNNDAKRTDDDGGVAAANSLTTSTTHNKENLRQQLGNFVITLKSGSAFGEVALMSEDCIRSATVIADIPTDLMVIDRDLYNRSIKSVLKAEFDQKANFIQENPYFNKWNAKYKKQLTMALEKEKLSYESELTKQGSKMDAIYFILSGEVKVLVDPDQHALQYPNTVSTSNIYSASANESNEALHMTRLPANYESGSFSKKTSRKGRKIGVCLLSVNEAIGDIEVLLGLSTYMQTCICTQPTEVLVMGMKHYERLLVRRNPRTITSMRAGLELRISSRMANCKGSHVPLLAFLKRQAANFSVNNSRLQRPKQQKLSDRETKEQVLKDAAESSHTHRSQKPQSVSTFLQPGKTQAKWVNMKPENGFNQVIPKKQVSNLLSMERNGDVNETTSTEKNANVLIDFGESVDLNQVIDSDSALEHLERKITVWMTNDCETKRTLSYKGMTTPRITKLHRIETEMDQMKPGAKILIRPKKPVEPFDGKEEDDKGKPMSMAELAYYRMALTASVPTFEMNDTGEVHGRLDKN